MTGPIRPNDVPARQAADIPEAVFEVFNVLIAKDWDGRSATVRQEDAVSEIEKKLHIYRHEVFSRRLLNVEEAYRAAGWTVTYDKPGFNETYEATWEFKR